ncbi:putative glycerophosphoryl diester phosphodiesterase 1 [Clostridium puniceum]|uniref:Putative glycerophosphoryl diester phosphodiesterase 1 n=1 Tax=Clostridium puniceum TaxID=29367 RepID=A0A1S8TN55_9CLOT|nr:glycerophosphodiester phosphodiesterase family protein [Clostridium puniceum]OOM79032.1 putative glycerophosphoryl diester phosphodiesterase 1 [Clostridium puniceum]
MEILNIAHRGYSGKFDENTMLAFRKAIEYKADGIETDVQLSKDGALILIHDETLDRTTNGHGFVKDYTLDELKIFRTKSVPRVQALKDDSLEEMEHLKEKELFIDKFQVSDTELTKKSSNVSINNSNGKVGEYTRKEVEYFQKKDGEEIPTLRELLEIFSQSDLKVLNLELKNSVIEYDGLEEKVLNIIDEFNLGDRVVISSFNHMSLTKIREIEKQKSKLKGKEYSYRKTVLGALTDSTLVNVPKYLQAISVECYHPYFPSILNKEYMNAIKKAGIKVNTYTVNNIRDMKKVMSVGADSIITNEVELLNILKAKSAEYE